MIPTGKPITHEIKVARKAISSVMGPRRTTNWVTLSPRRSDLPNWPVPMSRSHLAYWTTYGSRSPSACSRFARCSTVIRRAPSRPKMATSGSPGRRRMAMKMIMLTPRRVGTTSRSRLARYVRILSASYAEGRAGVARSRHPGTRLLVNPDGVPLVGVVVGVAAGLGQPLHVVVPAIGAAAIGHASVWHLVVEDLVQLAAELHLLLLVQLHGELVEKLVELGVLEVREVAVGLLARGLVDAEACADGGAQVGAPEARGVGDDVEGPRHLPVHHRGDLYDLELGLHAEEPLPLGLGVRGQLPVLRGLPDHEVEGLGNPVREPSVGHELLGVGDGLVASRRRVWILLHQLLVGLAVRGRKVVAQLLGRVELLGNLAERVLVEGQVERAPDTVVVERWVLVVEPDPRAQVRRHPDETRHVAARLHLLVRAGIEPHRPIHLPAEQRRGELRRPGLQPHVDDAIDVRDVGIPVVRVPDHLPRLGGAVLVHEWPGAREVVDLLEVALVLVEGLLAGDDVPAA